MKPLLFIEKYLSAANQITKDWQIPPIVTLAQAAVESGWGTKAPGYNFFGYSASENYNGKRQLLKTVEYHTSPDVKYPVIISITNMGNKYKYVVRKFFKCYSNPVESFTDYATLISSDKYESAFDYTDDPERFFTVIYNAGYATNPAYYQLVISVMQTLKKYITT